MYIAEDMVEIVRVTKSSGIPLIGCIAFGVIDRGTNLIQVRATSVCNMNCLFCSTDAGPFSKFHKTNFVVDVDYLIEETKKVAEYKGENTKVFIDSVGEPTTYQDFITLVEGLSSISQISEISMITNATLLSKEFINQLEKAGLSQINVSLHTLNEELGKSLFGSNNYNLKKILTLLDYISKSKIKLIITPVFLPNINDTDIEDILKLSIKLDCEIGIQKYEVYPFSRKINKVHKQTYWKFYDKIKDWEKDYSKRLRIKKEDFSIINTKRLPCTLKKGERVSLLIKSPGWFNGQMIGVAKNRCVSVNNCRAKINDRINVKIIENKNNIYVSTTI